MGTPRRRLSDEELLEAAWEIVQEELGWSEPEGPSVSNPEAPKPPRLLASINAGEVAKRCEVTTGAFYRRWKNRSEFVDELASYVLNYARHDDYLVEAHREYDDAIRHQKSITHLVYRVSGAHIAGAAKSAAFAVQMNLWSVAQRYPSIKRLLKKQYQDIDRDWVDKYTELLRVTGWQLRPGLSPEAVAIVLSGLAEGMAIRHAVDPDNATAELLGTAISAVVTASVDWSKDGKSVEQTLLRLASPE